MPDDITTVTPRALAKPEIWRPIFLKELERTSNVSKAAKRAGVHRVSAYNARSESPEFAQAWDDALDVGVNAVEETAFKRAKAGSDALIQFILKTRRRAIYGDKSTVQVGGVDGGPVKVEHAVESSSLAAFRATLASLGLTTDVADAGPLLPPPTD